jgi:hypothetical protein
MDCAVNLNIVLHELDPSRAHAVEAVSHIVVAEFVTAHLYS